MIEIIETTPPHKATITAWVYPAHLADALAGNCTSIPLYFQNSQFGNNAIPVEVPNPAPPPERTFDIKGMRMDGLERLRNGASFDEFDRLADEILIHELPRKTEGGE